MTDKERLDASFERIMRKEIERLQADVERLQAKIERLTGQNTRYDLSRYGRDQIKALQSELHNSMTVRGVLQEALEISVAKVKELQAEVERLRDDIARRDSDVETTSCRKGAK